MMYFVGISQIHAILTKSITENRNNSIGSLAEWLGNITAVPCDKSFRSSQTNKQQTKTQTIQPKTVHPVVDQQKSTQMKIRGKNSASNNE